MADDFAVGARLWLPCEVKAGPFTDERRVLVHGEGGDWIGFVNVRWLQEKEAEVGQNLVLAKVVEVADSSFRARIPGSAPQGGLFEGKRDRVAPA